MNQVYVGMTVRDAHRSVGTVVDVQDGGETGSRVTIRRHDGTTQTLTHGAYNVRGDTLEIASDRIVADSSGDSGRSEALPLTRTDAMELEDDENVTIPVVREEAVIGTRQVERGGVRVHKSVHEREEVAAQPTLREEVHVERVPIGRPIQSAPEAREEGDTLIIPVVEEMLVVQKQLVLKEEIRITRRRFTETEEVRVVLREEQVDIERLDDTERSRGNA